MDATRFDTVARLFADRRLSRRAAVRQGGAGLAAGAFAAAGLAATTRDRAAAQDATPPAGTAGEKIQYLFVQSFQSGSVAPKAGEDGTYTLTLEQGLGQTLFFSDRPERIVGAAPTPQFLEGLGFSPDNPPNAALVVEGADGQTEIAVVELFTPAYDEATHTATYEVAVLAEWEAALGVGLTEEPADLVAFGETFSAAHLFIDGCPDNYIKCASRMGEGKYLGSFAPQPMCYNYLVCMPCEPYGHTQPNRHATCDYWNNKCNEAFPSQCQGQCRNFANDSYNSLCLNS